MLPTSTRIINSSSVGINDQWYTFQTSRFLGPLAFSSRVIFIISSIQLNIQNTLCTFWFAIDYYLPATSTEHISVNIHPHLPTLSLSLTRAHTHTHARTHAHTHSHETETIVHLCWRLVGSSAKFTRTFLDTAELCFLCQLYFYPQIQVTVTMHLKQQPYVCVHIKIFRVLVSSQ